ncbi:conserved hypothetical protein [Ricinus communis]|uniref:Uncharacterized protein n=1 Tax=Ricinus communis TaxID=3988 RepID=B9TPS8_RICCO|nr:conserved hypothetical protein [Ricinus communis]
MTGRRHDDQFIHHPRLHLDIIGVARPLDQTRIDLEIDHRIDDVSRIGHQRAHPRARVILAVGRDHGRQHVAADGGGGADMQFTARLRITELALDGLRGVEHVARLRQQLAAAVIEHQALADAIEQLHPQQMLQLIERRTGSRLRQGHQVRRRGGRAGLRHGQEDLQLPQCDFHVLRSGKTTRSTN